LGGLCGGVVDLVSSYNYIAMKILIACEESQAVCKEFRKLGHEAYSCDILPCSGGHPEWHLQGDVLEQLYKGWDMMIAFPPCTYLSYAGIRWFNIEKYGNKAKQRHKLREDALNFFMKLWRAPIKKICIENPRGYAMKFIKPSQIVHPWYFGDPHKKTTCFWLKGLTRLNGKTEIAMNKIKYEPSPIYIDKSGKKRYFTDAMKGSGNSRQMNRSKTFPGIAKAMGLQWGKL